MYERATVLLPGDATKTAKVGVLGFALGKIQRRVAADRGGNRLVDERLDGRHADRLEHRGTFCRVGSDVSGCERTGGFWNHLAQC